ncbi:protein of unknown function [Nitrosotalea devaniterrae]|uniref:Uncharacterized protein n=1 Tax=Nitrosotalea devaniterrae TaxID=1078905 RepID=A0A128A4N9_9ARCH|nr:protein of unknown function [Candidatus Nitrosotalea devanaterra]
MFHSPGLQRWSPHTLLPNNLYVLTLSPKSDLGVNAFATGSNNMTDITPNSVAANTGFMSTCNYFQTLNQLLMKTAQLFYLTTNSISEIILYYT